METKLFCPRCHVQECYMETENDIDSYLCMNCGYTTNSLYIDGSEKIQEWEESTPVLIKKAKFLDESTNLVWYPSVLNFPSIGMIFPDGTNEYDWIWRAAEVVTIPENERSQYPIPGKDGEFYTNKLDLENSKVYDQDKFRDACIDLGILQIES